MAQHDKPEGSGETWKSIADLCRPLSAKVMSDRSLWSTGGRKMSPARALEASRKAGRDVRVPRVPS